MQHINRLTAKAQTDWSVCTPVDLNQKDLLKRETCKFELYSDALSLWQEGASLWRVVELVTLSTKYWAALTSQLPSLSPELYNYNVWLYLITPRSEALRKTHLLLGRGLRSPSAFLFLVGKKITGEYSNQCTEDNRLLPRFSKLYLMTTQKNILSTETLPDSPGSL